MLENEIKKSQVLLLTMKKSDYPKKHFLLLKAFSKASTMTCYVTLSKPADSLIEELDKLKLKSQKFHFIDAITKTVKSAENTDQCSFVSSPTALTELSMTFSDTVVNFNCDNCLVEPLSALLVYQDINKVLQFAQNLITKVRVSNIKVSILVFEDDNKQLVKDLHMFVDKAVKL
ncbi:hypothetical protein GOV04_03295 [Candidatus Woesearchaeota archaeon]|nr:hypothetical protein [Candidatus Woesearchaeota archaeon]